MQQTVEIKNHARTTYTNREKGKTRETYDNSCLLLHLSKLRAFMHIVYLRYVMRNFAYIIKTISL